MNDGTRERPEIVMLAADLPKKNCYYIPIQHPSGLVYICINTYTAADTHTFTHTRYSKKNTSQCAVNWHKSETNHKMLLKLHERYVFIVVSLAQHRLLRFAFRWSCSISKKKSEKNESAEVKRRKEKGKSERLRGEEEKVTTLLFEHPKEARKSAEQMNKRKP